MKKEMRNQEGKKEEEDEQGEEGCKREDESEKKSFI
jgi:hypothetical protein